MTVILIVEEANLLCFESLAKRKVSKNKAISILIGAVVASVLFGVYHFAHSLPFNEVNMVLFLMIPAIAPSVVYFIGRYIYATIIIQNFLGIFGVMQTIDLQAYSQPVFQMYVLTIDHSCYRCLNCSQYNSSEKRS
jgi:hypothetical protein